MLIVSEKSHQNQSDYIQFLLKKKIHSMKKWIISSEKKREIQLIICKIMLTHSSERIFNPSHYNGLKFYHVLYNNVSSLYCIHKLIITRKFSII